MMGGWPNMRWDVQYACGIETLVFFSRTLNIQHKDDEIWGKGVGALNERWGLG